MLKCIFHPAWQSKCNKDVVAGGTCCEEHSKVKCSVCEKQATRECEETSSLVCGAPLCATCSCKYHNL
jgi:hypothetical protein